MSPRARTILLIAGILAIAANLRTPITSLPPLLDLIQHSFALGTAAAGMLTTLPLIAFAAVSPVAGRLARKWGLERALFGALLLIVLGAFLRSAGTATTLYLGTWVIGSAIAIGNVLLPSLLKRDFPNRIAMLTSIYVPMMGVMAGIGSALAVPLVEATGLGWPLALILMVMAPALVSGLLWLPQLRQRSLPAEGAAPLQKQSLWRAPLAWQVTLFLGLNSLIYYIAIGWLPAILGAAGYSAAEAGSLHGVLQFASAVPGLVLAPLLNRIRDQRAIAFGVSLIAMASFIGLLLAPSFALLWTFLCGFGLGSTIILGLTFISLRVTTVPQAAALSGMAQSVGYSLAAAGPPVTGLMHELSHSWSPVLVLCIILSLAMAVMGLFAGRNVKLPAPGELPTPS